MKRRAEVARAEQVEAMAGSLLAARQADLREDAEFDALYGEVDLPTPIRAAHPAQPPAMALPKGMPKPPSMRR